MGRLLSFVRVVPLQVALPAAALALLCSWAYWPTWCDMAHKWAQDPQYSHGYLVPLFAVVLLWLRRARAGTISLQCNWWGVLFLVVGTLLRMVGVLYYSDW